MFRKGLVLSWVGVIAVLALVLGCQPSQPVATPQTVEKGAAAAPTKPAEKAAEKPVRGGTLRYAITADYAGLDPNTITPMNGFYPLYEELVSSDKDGNLTKELLAKDWTFGSDGKSITFKLREGVKFHDGTAFNAEAVKFNIDRIMDPATKSSFRNNYDAVASVEVVDPLTVRFNLTQPDALLLPRMAGSAGGLMVSPAGVQKYGVDFTRHPVGTGPFQFVEWVTGSYLTYKRFEGYWKKDRDGNQLPYLEGMVYQIIPDESTAVANLRTGQVDFMKGVPSSLLPLIERDPNLTTMSQPGNVTGVAINTKRPPFDNKALRQAVALALDREGTASTLGTIPWASIVPLPEKALFDDGKSGVFPARDLAKAKAKMAEAGYPSGGLKVKYTGPNWSDSVMAAQILKANLAEIGIEVELEILSSVEHNSKVRLKSDYQLSPGTTGIPIGDPGQSLSMWWHSKNVRNFYGPYSNPRFDEALDKALVTYDQKARAALYSEAFKVMVEDVPWVPLYVTTSAVGMSKKVRNYYFEGSYDRDREVWLAQ